MRGGLHLETLLAAGYALFLAGVAGILEWLARRSHHRARQYFTAGFKYHHGLDAWECPTGQHLHRQGAHGPHLARYQAPAHVCNACAIKHRCTDSDQGREIVHSTVSWLESEIGRFHRGISIALLLLGQLILLVELGRCHAPLDRALLIGVLAPLGFYGSRMLIRLRAAPAAKRD